MDLKDPATKQEHQLFWDKVLITHDDECWLWQSALTWNGYGRTWFRGTTRKASRVAYFLERSRWPEPFCLHEPTCLRSCVNPKHLREGGYRENFRDDQSPHKYPAHRKWWNK